MSSFINALTATEGGLSASTFFSILGDCVPLLLILIPVSIGFTVVRRLVRGASQARVNM